MTDLILPAATPSRCYLLELPGELRNRIYDYVLIHRDPYKDRDLDRPYTVRLRARPYPNWACIISPSCGYYSSWGLLKRQTLGLTQTCRATRREFLPLHLSQVQVEFMYSDEVPRYILDFFLRPEDAYGTCFLLRQRVKHLEVLPFIQYLSKSPGLTLRFDKMQGRDPVNMNALVDIKGNQEWRDYVERYVTGIAYYTDYSYFLSRSDANQLFVNIRHTVKEPWMLEEKEEDTGDEGNSTREKTPANKPECVKKWLEFAGIPQLDKTLDDVGIQVAAADEDSDSEASANGD